MIETSYSPPRHQSRRGEEHKTASWWKILVSISAFNVVVWIWSFSTIEKANSWQRRHLLLSGIYTLVCFYRSVLPRIDLERYCFIDTQLSSMTLGRSAATVAEICFSMQFALLLFQLGDNYDLPLSRTFSFFIVPLITSAQIFCWFGVITLNHLCHAIEESIWAFCSAVISGCFAAFLIYNNKEAGVIYTFATIGSVVSFAYFIFMVRVDVPMYLSRWREGKVNGTRRMTFKEGRKDAWSRRVVTRDWEIWKHEAPWLTGYFSFAVWISLSLVHISVV